MGKIKEDIGRYIGRPPIKKGRWKFGT